MVQRSLICSCAYNSLSLSLHTLHIPHIHIHSFCNIQYIHPCPPMYSRLIIIVPVCFAQCLFHQTKAGERRVWPCGTEFMSQRRCAWCDVNWVYTFWSRGVQSVQSSCRGGKGSWQNWVGASMGWLLVFNLWFWDHDQTKAGTIWLNNNGHTVDVNINTPGRPSPWLCREEVSSLIQNRATSPWRS